MAQNESDVQVDADVLRALVSKNLKRPVCLRPMLNRRRMSWSVLISAVFTHMGSSGWNTMSSVFLRGV